MRRKDEKIANYQLSGTVLTPADDKKATGPYTRSPKDHTELTLNSAPSQLASVGTLHHFLCHHVSNIQQQISVMVLDFCCTPTSHHSYTQCCSIKHLNSTLTLAMLHQSTLYSQGSLEALSPGARTRGRAMHLCHPEQL